MFNRGVLHVVPRFLNVDLVLQAGVMTPGGGHPGSAEVDDVPHIHQMPFAASNPPFRFTAGGSEFRPDRREVSLIAFQVLECGPTSLPVDGHGCALGDPLLGWEIGPVFREMQGRVVDVIHAQEQDLTVEVVQAGEW